MTDSSFIFQVLILFLHDNFSIVGCFVFFLSFLGIESLGSFLSNAYNRRFGIPDVILLACCLESVAALSFLYVPSYAGCYSKLGTLQSFSMRRQ